MIEPSSHFTILTPCVQFVQHFTHRFATSGDITSLNFDAASKMLIAASTENTIQVLKITLMQPMDPDRRKLEAVVHKSFNIEHFRPQVAVFDQLQPANARDILLFGLRDSGPL